MPLPPELATTEGQMAVTCVLLVASLEKMEAENAKLRELVRDLVTTVRGCGTDEDGYGQLPCEEVCPHWSNNGECTRLHRDQCWYEEQARELGIEADE